MKGINDLKNLSFTWSDLSASICFLFATSTASWCSLLSLAERSRGDSINDALSYNVFFLCGIRGDEALVEEETGTSVAAAFTAAVGELKEAGWSCLGDLGEDVDPEVLLEMLEAPVARRETGFLGLEKEGDPPSTGDLSMSRMPPLLCSSNRTACETLAEVRFARLR